MFPRPKPPHYHRMLNAGLVRAVPPDAIVILDVGCGAGVHGAALKSLVPGRTVYGLENDPDAAAQARTRLDRVFVADAEAEDVPVEEGSLDCVLYGDVLEHLRDPEAVLARHRRLLKLGGVAVCSIPNLGHHEVLADLLRGDFPYAAAGILDATHLRFFTLASFAKLLLDAGYAPEPVEALPGPSPLPPEFAQALAPALARLGVHPGRAAARLAAYQYVFRAHSLPDPPAEGGEPMTVVCCASDEAVLRANLLSSPDLAPGSPHEVVVARGCKSAAEGLNAGLERARHRLVVAAHQDVYLPRGWFARVAAGWRHAEEALGRVGVAGVYGVAGRGPGAARVGRVVDRGKLLSEPAALPAAVDALDELVLVVDRSSGLRFEPSVGFHLYGTDVCLSARRAGLAAAVVDAVCLHNSQTVALPESFAASAAALAAKWPDELPVTSPSAEVGPGGRVVVDRGAGGGRRAPAPATARPSGVRGSPGARYLFGPVDSEAFMDRFLHAPVEAGRWATFGAACASWEEVVAGLEKSPEALLVWPSYTSVPAWVWSAPVPVVVLAADGGLLAHEYRHLLPLADLVLTDAPSVERLQRAGIAQARAANLFGLDRHFLAEMDTTEVDRDLDIVFAGNLSPSVQGGRARWLGRLGALAAKYRVSIASGVFDAEYRHLLRRAKLVFNHAARSECNLRALEAAASGAVLLQEAGNAEVREYLAPGSEYAPYTEADFEDVVARLLASEEERAAIASRAKERVRGYSFDSLVEAAVGVGAEGWDEVVERAARRAASPVTVPLAGRVWQKAALSAPDADPTLHADLEAAGDRHARGVLAKSPAESEAHLAAAAGAGNRVSAVGHASALVALGRNPDAVAVLRKVLTDLQADPTLSDAERDSVPYPVRFDHLRVGWERAAFDHADDPEAESSAKIALLTGRAAAVLAELTGEIDAYRLAADACPHIPAARAALGCALARASQFAEGIAHLRFAVEHDPFDAPAARALEAALSADGDAEGAKAARQTRRVLARAAPRLVPDPDQDPPRPTPAPQPSVPAAGRGLASLVVLCCNEVGVTRLCLESVLAHTRPPYELVLIDNGSSDGTIDYLHSIGRRDGPEKVTVVRNESNRGYPAGVNQGLSVAEGEHLVLLNNDVVVTPGWLDRLVRCSLTSGRGQPRLAGAVTNYAPPPQLVEPGYDTLAGLDAFARRRAAEFDGRALEVVRLTGFCLLVPRGVMEKVGRLDEQFGLGFFDDDDLCLRARRAGFTLAVALDCYVHHFGSQTFRAMGVDAARQLQDNLALYRAKWGDAEAAKYRMPAPGVVAPASYQPVTVLSDVPVIVPAVPRGKPRVSLTMIVKNEQHNLPECLASVRDLVDEAVVIDTGSTDRTREIIRSFGCVEGEFPWVDDFAAARNAALDRASGDYAFWMDADDRLDPENRAALKTLLANLRGGNDAYAMKCLCVPDKPGAGATVVDHVRLFRRLAEHRWKYRVHEQILPSLRATGASVTWTGVTVRHVGYVDPAVRRRKLDRDLRLLRLDHTEHPSDPFTLFNLGSVFNERGDYAAAVDALSKSLAASHVKDSIVRKLYALLSQCHGKGGDRNKAAETLKEGRTHYPDDAELLFLAANLARERGDQRGAEALYRRLIDGSEGDHFGSVDAGLRAVKGRHNLAVMLLDQNRGAESEGLWRAALVADPLFLPAHAGLGELYLKTANAGGVAAQAAALRELGPDGAAEAAVLDGRWLLARKDHAGAAAVLEAAAREFPQSVGVRVALSHVRLAEGAAPEVLEAAFKSVLELDPTNAQARHNMEVLMRTTGRWVEGVIDPPGPGGPV